MNKKSHYIVKTGYYGFVILVVGILLFGFKELFIPLVLGVLGTFVFEPVVDRLEIKTGTRMKAVLLLFLGLGLIFTLFGFLFLPLLIEQVGTIHERIPEFAGRLEVLVNQLQGTLQERFPETTIPDLWGEINKVLGTNESVSVDDALGVLSRFASVFSVLLFAPIISFFFLVDGASFQKALFHVVPNRYFEMFMLLFHKIVSALKSFLRGQVIDAAAVGLLTALGLTMVGLPYGMLIGMVAGIANLIPYLGPIMGFIPAAIVLLGQEGTTAFSFIPVAAVFFGVQFFEGAFIYPIAVGKSVNLHPLVVMLAVTLGGQVAGLPGMLLVIPIISMIKVSFEVLNSYLKGYGII